VPPEPTSHQLSIIDPKSDPKSDYVLVTPVRNEEAFIERTIQSVLNQTLLPKEWVIVSDGSTDKTDAIIQAAIQNHPWIKLIQLPQREYPCFAAVVENTTLGVQSISFEDYSFLGLLDSDLEFQKDYFDKLIEEFSIDPKLGLAGGVAIDIGLPKDNLPANRNDVPGALQFFRKECLKDIGPFIPIPEGGWDCITCTTARMKGWNTRLISHLIVDHLKPRNISQGGTLRRIWQMGIRDYAIGYHPLFEFLKCLGKCRASPPLIAAVVWWLGYCQASIQQRKRIVPIEIVNHTRREQFLRIQQAFSLSRRP
jgi:poly-beta-1,6-N-acetyl-D-glucosamine synthase